MSTDRIRAVLKLLIETIVGLELEGQQEVDDAIALASAALATKPDEEVVAATQRLEALAAFMEPGSQDRWVVENAASLLAQISGAFPAVVPVAVSKALIKAECALADQVVPEGSACMIRMPETDVDGNEAGGMLLTAEPNARIRAEILAIAAELGGEYAVAWARHLLTRGQD